MRNYQAKPVWQRLFSSTPMILIMGALLLVFAWNIATFVGKMDTVIKNRKIAEEKTSELRDSKSRLEANIAELNTEEGVEKVIREKYGLGKEGEGLVVILDDKDNKEVEDKKGAFAGIASFFENFFNLK